MSRKLFVAGAFALATLAPTARAASDADLAEIRRQIQSLKDDYEARIRALEERLKEAQGRAAAPVPAATPSSGGAGLAAFNPAISLILANTYANLSQNPTHFAIAGFPTETDAMFEGSLRLVDDCGLTFLHVFPFSPRPGTPAARMPQVARTLVKDRAAQLRSKGEAALVGHLAGLVGGTDEVLVERKGPGGTLARTPGFAEMEIDTRAEPGEVVSAHITAACGKRLRGQVVDPMCAS